MDDIYDLLDEVAIWGNVPTEWAEKMIHKVPPAPVIDRAEYLTKASRNKVILDVGASGPMSEILAKEAKEYYGIDIAEDPGLPNYYQIDLENPYGDDYDDLPYIPDLELIVAGETLEHLSNAGGFLDFLHKYGVQVIVTVPNAFSAGSGGNLKLGIETVNKDHVAWYSYHTLKTLVERHNFQILLWAWYNGKPMTAEGLIFHIDPVGERSSANGKD
jgi:hypothetical protein